MAPVQHAFPLLATAFLASALAPSPLSAQASALSVTTWVSSTAALFGPEGVAADASGNVYVSTLNNTIQRISPQGTVTTLAGIPSQFGGYADGSAAEAQFSAPRGLAVDAAGNVYVADSGNYAVRRIGADGSVTTLAGASAQLANPTGVAVDAAGDVYVADDDSQTIRKIAPDGTISVFAGQPYLTGLVDGTGSAARFNGPVALAIDAQGNLYVADAGNHAIREVTPAGVVTTLATGIDDPEAVALDGAGHLYVCDENDSTIVALSAAGAASVVAGATGERGDTDGAGSAARLTVPCGLALLPGGAFAIVDWEIDAVRLGAPVAAQAAAAEDPPDARLVNVSTRAEAGVDGQDVIVGFVIGGTGTKTVLVRGVGPTLATFGVTGVLAQPEVTLFGAGEEPILSAGAWGGDPTVAATMAQVGAFALPSDSADAAFVQTLGTGSYTAQVSGADDTSGVALAELYDADGAAATSRILNLSARAYVGTGAGALVAGFVVAGTGTETVLIRGIGPTLAQYGVAGALPATQLTLYDGNGQPIASNSGWGGSAALASVFAQVGAFPLPAGSADSALTATLSPGTYTAQVTGSAGSQGVGLVEIYEVPGN